MTVSGKFLMNDSYIENGCFGSTMYYLLLSLPFSMKRVKGTINNPAYFCSSVYSTIPSSVHLSGFFGSYIFTTASPTQASQKQLHDKVVTVIFIPVIRWWVSIGRWWNSPSRGTYSISKTHISATALPHIALKFHELDLCTFAWIIYIYM